MKRIRQIAIALTLVSLVAVGSWFAGTNIKSPAEEAARTASPKASPILVPVEERVLSSDIVTRGTARFGLPQSISIAPSALKPLNSGVITTLPLRNTQFVEGDIMLTASGRPVFILTGKVPAYRDLAPGISGDDVLQLENGLDRLGFDPGLVDGTYDQKTSTAVAAWYIAAGFEPFGATESELAKIRALELELVTATNDKLATEEKAATAPLAVRAAISAAEVQVTDAVNKKLAAEEKAATARLAVQAAKDEMQAAVSAAQIKVTEQQKIRSEVWYAERPIQELLDADAALQSVEDAAQAVRTAGEAAVRTAIDAQNAAERETQAAEDAAQAARTAGETAVQTAIDAQKAAEREAQATADSVARLTVDLETAQLKAGVKVPIDEIVFLPTLPVRVEQISRAVGDAASGPVMTVTNNQLAIDSSLALDEAPLVKPGMTVAIDEPDLGITATGVVERVADTPGTFGVDGFHIYFEILVDPTPTPLEGFSLRLTIPVESTGGKVIAVPVSALSMAADGTSRVQVDDNGIVTFVVVTPGLSANGFVEVTPVDGTLTPGQLVVVGYERK